VNNPTQQRLLPATPLQGWHYQFADTTAKEAPQQSIVSIAFSASNENAVSKQLQAHMGFELPDVGRLARDDAGTSLLRLQSDQCFLVTSQVWADPVEHLNSVCGKNAYYTDQSDSWVVLDISGSLWRDALQRLCMIDLHNEVFTLSHCARTTMEHISVIVHRCEEQQIRLFSPRSSAKSFAHAIETSLHNVVPIEE